MDGNTTAVSQKSTSIGIPPEIAEKNRSRWLWQEFRDPTAKKLQRKNPIHQAPSGSP